MVTLNFRNSSLEEITEFGQTVDEYIRVHAFIKVKGIYFQRFT